MARQINIPPQYSARVGGNGINWKTITVDADSDFMAARKLVNYGIPFAAANSFGTSTIPGTGAEGITALEAISPKTGRSLVSQATGANLGSGLEEGSKEAAGRIRRFGGKDGIFGGEESSDTGFATPTNAFDPTQVGLGTGKNITKGQQENKRKALVEGQIPMGEGQGFTEGQFDPNSVTNQNNTSKFTPSGFKTDGDDSSQLSFGGDMDADSVIAMFFEGGEFGNALITDPETGIEQLNPLLAQLLDRADMQNGRISDQQIAQIQQDAAVDVARFQKSEAISVAQREGITGKALASINTKSDERIATAQALSDERIAASQALAQQAIATTNAEAQKNIAGTQGASDVSVATIGAGGQLGAAEAAAGGQVGAAQAAAGAASPFGFMQQATTNDAQQTPEQQLKAIYDELNAVGLAQAGAANIGAQDNAFSFAAGQARNPVTGELDFDPNQIGQIAANTPAAFAAKGQEAAARAGATGFGALLSGNAAQQANANAILRAQAANNPYAMQQLGQGWAGTGAADQNARIDQILRGGLSAQQRLAEINASQSGQNFANQLNFMSNPSAVGFATEQGLFGGGNNQILQDINNSPEGNVPGSLFGFNSPSSAGAGGGQTTTVNTDNFNPNLSTFKNASPEQMGFYQGMQSAGGQTPREVQDSMESFTPQGL